MGFGSFVSSVAGSIFHGATNVGGTALDIVNETLTAVGGQGTELVGGFTSGILTAGGEFAGFTGQTIEWTGLDDTFPPLKWVEDINYFTEDVAKDEIVQALAPVVLVAIIMWSNPAWYATMTAEISAALAPTTAELTFAGYEAGSFTAEAMASYESAGLITSEASILADLSGTIAPTAALMEGTASSALTWKDLYTVYSAYSGVSGIGDAYQAYQDYQKFKKNPYQNIFDFSENSEGGIGIPARTYNTHNILYEDDNELYYIVNDFRGFITKLIEVIPTSSSAPGKYSAKSLLKSLKEGNLTMDSLKSLGG